MRKIIVLFNPVAGRGRAKKLWPAVENALQRLDAQICVEATGHRGHARALAEAYAREGADLIVAAGGDGTVHEVVNGILAGSDGTPPSPMAIIPLGSGDDFVKMLPPETAIGNQAFSWQEAVKKIAGFNTSGFDVGRIVMEGPGFQQATARQRYFINGMNLGFTAHAAWNFSTIPRFLTGSAGYLAAVLKTLWHYPELNLRMAFDDGPEEEIQTSLAALMNGRCFGHAFWVAPHADAADGLLEVMMTKKIGRAAILRKLPLMMKGKHVNDPLVTWHRTSKVRISSQLPLIVEADGESLCADAREILVEVIPGGLQVVV